MKLPLPCESNTKAWMNATIFEKWVKQLDSRMRKRNLKIALLLDNSTAHPNVSGLTNTKAGIFASQHHCEDPTNVCPGVIRCFEAHYRKSLAKMRLLAFEEKKDFKVDVLDGMRLLSQAWDSVREATIQNCLKSQLHPT